MTRKKVTIEVMDDAMADILRKKTGLERLEIAFGMWECAQEMIQYRVEDEHQLW